MIGAAPIARRMFEVTGTRFLIDDATATSVMDQFAGGRVQAELNHQANADRDG